MSGKSQRQIAEDLDASQRTGRVKVMGRIAGQMIAVIFALLYQDAEMLRRLPVGAQPSAPVLDDPKRQRQHRAEHDWLG